MPISDMLESIGFPLAILVCVVVLMPSPLDPVLWKSPFPLPKMDGKWESNLALAKTIKVLPKNVTAPESLAMDADTGFVYASLSDGRVVRVSGNGEKLDEVFFVGGYILNQDGKNETSIADLKAWCTSQARQSKLAWNVDGERRCGRPLGLRFKKAEKTPFLYILDAYYGLFRINLNDQSVFRVITPEICGKSVDNINLSYQTDPIISNPCKFMNDFDVTSAGVVIFTDTSYKHTRSQNRQEIMDGSPRGRLFAYYPKQKQIKTLLCGLHFPNGVQLFPDEKSVLMAESARFRLLKVDFSIISQHYTSSKLLQDCSEDGSLSQLLNSSSSSPSQTPLSSPSNPGVSVFLDEIPGFVDNIRSDSKNKQHFLLGFGTKSSKPFSLLWTAYQSNLLRYVIGRLVPMKYIEKLVPKYGLIAVVNTQGEVVTTLHDPTGENIHMISEAQRHPITGDLWMGSHSNHFIGFLKAEHVTM